LSRAAATLAVAAIFGLVLNATPTAQAAPSGKTHRPPTAKPVAPQTPALAPPPLGGPPADPGFAAFQRGYYLTAFSLATKRAMENDDPKSMTLLGELYANGLGVPEDIAKASKWYELAAARGDPNAMFALAIFSIKGQGVPRDRDKSAKWLAAAAKLDHPIAAYDLALLYMEGELFPQDFTRAAELMRIAADAGNPQAQYALGTLYKQGRGVPKDMREAVKLFARAAIGDQADAETEYAIALFNGDGVERNQKLAVALFHQAALKGNPIAQDRLAVIFSKGLGTAANPVEAVKWHLTSKARGETDLELDDFVNKLDPKTRAAGEKAAKPWVDAVKRIIAARTREAASSPPAK
jgi:uncharacterized protein